ncbi:M10 family metallopeptidase C-terminal domain-containing protein [Pseudomonas orientalis]|uniref:M10 family metallopeptidase C-terminal domain-containing protein n=1 Tax=Pseudomonas orientalis TaxID=76758 RepID=UPI0013DDEEE2|nr:M10 family metallopeptidase C-terminal domain-containing protein [Pseudomonas orientalis]
MSSPVTFTVSPFASNTITQLDRVLHDDQRGGGRMINGKPSYTVQQAAAEITREKSRWHDTNGDGKTDITYQFRTTPGPFFRIHGLSGFSEFNQAQKDSAREAMNHWSDMTNVRFTEAGPGVLGEGHIGLGNFAESTNGQNAFAKKPPPEASQRHLANNPNVPRDWATSEVWLNSTDEDHMAPSRTNEGHLTIAHELDHAMGLSHPFRSPPEGSDASYHTATYAEDTLGYSILSYWNESNTGQSFSKNGVHYSPSTPMVDDIAARQSVYGANHETRAGDTIYGFNSNADRAAYRLSSSADAPVFTVWDGGGVDTLDFSGFNQDQIINLNEGAPSDVGGMKKNVFIAKGTTIENAKGGSGKDIFISNLTQNILTGGAGKNTYLYLDPQQSAAHQPDRITDFVPGEDKVDISNLRATGPLTSYVDESDVNRVRTSWYGMSVVPLRDIAEKPVDFVSRFSGAGRQAILNYDAETRQATLQIDLDGDRSADFALKIDSQKPVQKTDFVT